MSGIEGETRDEARKLRFAIRCAKAALLLSSLKSSVSRVFEAANNDEDEERNCKSEGGFSEGATEHQENQTLWSNGADSSTHLGYVDFQFLYGASNSIQLLPL